MLQIRHPRQRLALWLGIALVLAPLGAAVQARADEAHGGVRAILSTGTTVTNEPIRYPTQVAAHITAVEITLAPGQQTGWHSHPVPLFGYILEGELTVDYGPLGQRTYRQGDGLAEAMNEAHNDRNSGAGPVRILAVFMGADGVKDTVAAAVPPR
jgi:quercetin dioxygenase-like cupin family protein